MVLLVVTALAFVLAGGAVPPLGGVFPPIAGVFTPDGESLTLAVDVFTPETDVLPPAITLPPDFPPVAVLLLVILDGFLAVSGVFTPDLADWTPVLEDTAVLFRWLEVV